MSTLSRTTLNLSPKKLALLEKLRQQEGLGTAKNGRIPHHPHNGTAPLSYTQERFWFLEKMEPGRPLYNVPWAFEIKGRPNLAALREAFGALTARHEILRTTFPETDGRPRQCIAAEAAPSLTIRPVTGRADALRLAEEEARRPFNLAEGPLFRAHLLPLGEREHILTLNMHHIITDGWSMAVFTRELMALYAAFNDGRQPSLEPLPIQYADFARWQREQGERFAGQLDFWRHYLADSLPLLDVPADRPRPAVQRFRGGFETRLISAELSHSLKTFSRKQGATLYMTLLAAFKVLLHRCTGETDILVGTPTANRDRPETQNVLGPLLNTLVIRTDAGGNPTFAAFLERVRAGTLGAFANQDVPFEQVVEALNPARNLSHSPLFQVMFVMQNGPLDGPAFPGLTLEPLAVSSGATKFDLTLAVEETPKGLLVNLDYNTDLFDPSTVRRMLGRYERLLAEIAARPDAAIGSLSILTTAEREQLLDGWNDTQLEMAETQTFVQLFERQTAETPQAAVVTGPEGQTFTYEALNRRTNQVARGLRRLGVWPERFVGVCLEPSANALAALLGIWKAGGAYVPLDPAYPAERLAFMAADAGLAVVLSEKQWHEKAAGDSGTAVICLDDGWAAAESDASLELPADAGTAAYAIYTSGSTGRPKGVVVSHRNMMNYLAWVNDTLLPGGVRVPALTKLSFDAALKQLLAPLLRGEAVWLPPKDALRQPASLWLALQAEPRAALNCVPSLWQVMLDVLETNGEAALSEDFAPQTLSVLLLGGEAVPADLIERTRQALPDLRIWNLYGPTEATANACAGLIESAETITIGRPLANTRIYLLDDYLQPVPIGVPGELYIGGAGVARGYLGRPGMTAERFMPNPFCGPGGAGGRLYRTGDRACYLPDGTIAYLGRVDQQVKVRGFRIEPGEIEAALNRHSAVADSIVTAHQESSTGMDKRLVAYVVPVDQEAPSERLREWLQQRLPDHMVPRTFIWLDAWPLMANGKINRKALPAPNGARPAGRAGFVAPRDSLELQLAQIWESALNVQPIGVRDNFFDLGGHSLLAVHLMARIARAFDRELPVSLLFQQGTVEQLAAVLRQEAEFIAFSPVVPIQSQGERPPLFLIHPAGGTVLCYMELTRSLGSEQPVYGLEAVGTDGRRQPFTHMETMAAHYVAALRAIQAEGPYYLGGWCFGGTVAFAMAHELLAQGQQVAQLALIDTFAPRPPAPNVDLEAFEIGEAELLALFVKGLSGQLGQRVLVAAEELRPLPPEGRWELALARMQEAGLLPPDTDTGRLQRYLDIYMSNGQALDNYRPPLYPGPVTLLRAENEPAHQGYDETLGWQAYTAGPITVHETPGSHSTMVFAPNAAVLARTLQQCLERS